MSLTQENKCAHGTVSFFNELDTGKEFFSELAISFFNELDTGNRTMLMTSRFIF